MATLTENAAQPGNSFADDVQRLSADIGQIKNDLSGLARDANAAAHSGAAVAGEQVKSSLEAIKNKSAAAAETLGDTIARHPVASVGIALGVGFLVGMVVCRPRN